MSVTLTNNAETTLAAGISAVDTSIVLAAGQGALFPSPGANEWFPLTLIKADGTAYEIVRATNRSVDTITVIRGQEGTTAIAFVAGDFASHRATAAALLDLGDSGDGIVPDSVSGGTNKYVVSDPDITSYVQGLRVSFIAHASNTGPATLQVNGLAEIPIEQGDGTALVTGNFQLAQFVETVYESGRFVVDFVNDAAFPVSSTTEAGLSIRGTDVDYDIAGDDSKFTTQKSTSLIVQEALASSSITQLPQIWQNTGDAAGGNSTFINGATFNASVGFEIQFLNLEMQAGSLVFPFGKGVIVIRCLEKFTLAGDFQFPRGNGAYPNFAIGPTGSVNAQHASFVADIRNYPQLHPNQSTDGTGATPQGGSAIVKRLVEGSIYNGVPMNQFQGGAGASYGELVMPEQMAGGVIIIADEIDIQAGASFLQMYPIAEENFGGGAPKQGACGGGMIILAGNTVTIDPAATFEMATSASFLTAANAAIEPDAFPGEAGNGQLFTMNLATGALTEIF